MTNEKTCFVISPIGEAGSEIRERSDKLLNYVIEPAVEPYGYEPIRADDIAEPGIITSQVIEHVVESPLVVADLTGSNANVFYELAVRHAYQKPIIQLIDSDDNIPFDVAGTRTIQFDISDIESAENAKSEIGKQIENMEDNDQDIETPISTALDLKMLRESTDPEERSMANVMETLSELRTNMISIQNMLDDPQEVLPPEYFDELIQEADIDSGGARKYSVQRLEVLKNLLGELLESDEPVTEDDIKTLLLRVNHTISELKGAERINRVYEDERWKFEDA